MDDCRIVSASEYENRCAVHGRSQLECLHARVTDLDGKLRESDRQLDLVTKCNCPSPCNAQGCLLRELERARLQVRALSECLVERRAMEPKHSREDHTCKECEVVADIIHSEMRPQKLTCEHEWRDTNPSSIRGMQTCAKCSERRMNRAGIVAGHCPKCNQPVDNVIHFCQGEKRSVPMPNARHCLNGRDGCTSGAMSCSCPCSGCEAVRR